MTNDTNPQGTDEQQLFQQEFTRMQLELARLSQLTATTTTNRSTSAKQDRPAPFSGERSESVDTWLFQMEQYLRLTHVTADDQVETAASYLKKNAASWWMVEYQRAEARCYLIGWEEFKKKLQARFKPANAEENARDRLGRLKQTSSVAAYSHQFRIIMQDLPDMHERDALHFYRKGLKEAVALHVGLRGPQTVDQAEEMAEIVDAVLYENRREHARPPMIRPTYRSSSQSVPMEVDTIRRATLTEPERERLRREGRCFYCREGKHLARDCPEGKNTKKNLNLIDTEDEDYHQEKE